MKIGKNIFLNVIKIGKDLVNCLRDVGNSNVKWNDIFSL